MPGMKRINVYIPKPDLDAIDKVVEAEWFPNRSDFIRTAIREKLAKYHLP